MRFVHTADWQIGMRFPGLGHAAEKVRRERLAAGRRVVEAAGEKKAQFILVAGDLFEDNAVDRLLVQETADVLAQFAGPVFVIPGNHDPLVPGAVWEHPAWEAAGNITLLLKEEPVPLPGGGILFPCPLLTKHSLRDPTAWIPSEDPGGQIRIAMAHGTLESVGQEEPDHPISRVAATRAHLDYLALGHWHSLATYTEQGGRVRVAYCGTPETSRFGERQSGCALLVDIAAPGSPAMLTALETGGLTWLQVEDEIGGAEDLRRVQSQLEGLPSPGKTLVRVSLQGLLQAADQDIIGRIQQILEARFLYGQLDMEALLPAPEDDSWLSVLPPGVVRQAALKLREKACGSDAQAKVATRALMELYRIAGEVPL